MKYIIMCGGYYGYFEQPKSLTVVNGEPLVDRTIRLLIENGVAREDIKITSNDERLEGHGAEVLHHNNPFKWYKKDGKEITEGYWLDAFMRFDEPVCYLWGDVYYTNYGIKTIVEYKSLINTFFGTIDKNLKPWEEPLAYKVYDNETFFKGIEKVKKLFNEGKCRRHPIVWELYRVLNGINVNTHRLARGYVNVPGGGMDVDSPEQATKIGEYYA